MDEKNVVTNSPKAWLLAARPKTLCGASVPVIIGVALAVAFSTEGVRIMPAVLCFLFAFIMQIDANFVNDYFDFVRGNDDETRLGPKRACAQGWITAEAMRKGMISTTVLGCIVGLPLVFYGGWQMIVVGMLCVLFCFLYTTKLSYVGLGDVLVLVFFGIVPVCLTCYLVAPEALTEHFWIVFATSIACGLVIDTLLMVNNFRDIDNDRKSGKITLVVMLGKRCSLYFYLFLGFAAVVMVALTLAEEHILAASLPLFYLCVHIATWRRMKAIDHGFELNKVLGETSRNMLLFGVLVAIGLLL